MIKFTSGDMFETSADIRINTVNCAGVMGAGVALAFKNKYPDMFKDYQKDCKNDKVQPGKMHIWKNLTGDWIINFPTKTHWRKSSNYEDIESGLIALHKYLIDKGPVRVTLPALGCGHGGLDWNRVKGMIEKYLGDLEANIDVFEPIDSLKAGSAYSDKDTKASEETLINQGVKIIKPDMDMFPSTLKGKLASSLYVKGNEQILEQPILAFLSSQKPDEKEVDTALAYLDVIARPGLSIMVGYGPHVDRPIIRRALELGSDVIVSFPEGLLNFRIRNDLKDV
ncbi:macro domain-containing protein, partial [bacterium]|nr:macro domain-containing protein [bacterium]